MIPTVKVKSKDPAHKGFVVINESDFDPKVHQKFEDEPAGETTSGEDFSKLTVAELHDALDEAGVSYDASAKKADLVELLTKASAGK